jgi:hypothetical protein
MPIFIVALVVFGLLVLMPIAIGLARKIGGGPMAVVISLLLMAVTVAGFTLPLALPSQAVLITVVALWTLAICIAGLRK